MDSVAVAYKLQVDIIYCHTTSIGLYPFLVVLFFASNCTHTHSHSHVDTVHINATAARYTAGVETLGTYPSAAAAMHDHQMRRTIWGVHSFC